MPVIRIYRARIDIGNSASGLLFSYDPIVGAVSQLNGQDIKISETERFYVETPPGFELTVVAGRKLVHDPQAGRNVYMRAARLVSRIWQNQPGFQVIPSTSYDALDRGEQASDGI